MAEVVVVHGYAGSGKTTLCERLVQDGLEEKSVQHISAGNRVRDIRTDKIVSMFSDHIKSLPRSSPIPDSVINGVIFEAIDEQSEKDLLLLDGYPRHKRTVGLFHTTLLEQGHELLGTVFFRVPKATSIQRILERGIREGEKIENQNLQAEAERRYNRDAQRVHRAAKALGQIATLATIDANKDIDSVYADFATTVGLLLETNPAVPV